MLFRKFVPFAPSSTDTCHGTIPSDAYGVMEILGDGCRGLAPTSFASVKDRRLGRDARDARWLARTSFSSVHLVMLLLLFLMPSIHARTHSAFTKDLKPISIVQQ
ncbi:unnamed protein product, partial [Meganyctiphanes norvegica]